MLVSKGVTMICVRHVMKISPNPSSRLAFFRTDDAAEIASAAQAFACARSEKILQFLAAPY